MVKKLLLANALGRCRAEAGGPGPIEDRCWAVSSAPTRHPRRPLPCPAGRNGPLQRLGPAPSSSCGLATARSQQRENRTGEVDAADSRRGLGNQ